MVTRLRNKVVFKKNFYYYLRVYFALLNSQTLLFPEKWIDQNIVAVKECEHVFYAKKNTV